MTTKLQTAPTLSHPSSSQRLTECCTEMRFWFLAAIKRNAFLDKSVFKIWPAATNVVALRPHQTNIARFHPARAKRGSTAIPSWITPAVPATFSLFNQTTAAKKLRRKLIQL